MSVKFQIKLLTTLLFFLCTIPITRAQNSQGQRLSPQDINNLRQIGASAGTSGVSGIQTRVLKGDPNLYGLYTIQLSIPAHTKIEAHEHPDDRTATVISGTWFIGYGSFFDEAQLKALTPGSFYTEPPSIAHFARTGNEPVIIQITGYGPTGTTYTASQKDAELPKKSEYESKTVRVNGVNIHYLTAGIGRNPIVLIHGFGETSSMWIPLFKDFGKEFTIIAPDLRGLGGSSRPDSGYDKKTMAVDIHELVKSLGYKTIDLAGHDIGLMVAYAYAAQYPSEVEKLALLEAPIPGIGNIWEKIYSEPALWHFHFVDSPIALQLVNGRERLFLEHFWQTLSPHPETFSEAERELYAQSYAQEGVMRDAFSMFQKFNTTDAADNRSFALQKLTMPVLTIEGDKAMGGALAIQAKLVADNVTSITFTDTGHWLMEQRPNETRAELTKFFVPKSMSSNNQ